jgi:multidrug resistance efflux pump
MSVRHRPRRALLVVPLLLVIVVAGWGAVAAPWVRPADRLTASGTLEADEVLLSAEVSGRIVDIGQEGQTVAAGQLVARLDDSLIQLQIRQADVATRQQLDIQVERYQVRSPIAGVLTRVPMRAGEVVAPGQTVAAVASTRRLKLTVYVLERDLGQVQVGQQIAVTVDPFGSRTFDGTVTAINPRAEFTPRNVQTQRDRLNLVFGVKAVLDNPDGSLKPGMPADATFIPLS